MGFKDQLKQHGKRVSRLKDQILTEEATKSAFVMPFIQCLGYDVFNPLEVVPEFIADLGIMQAYYVVRSIVRQHMDVQRIGYRDTQSYMGILMDDNNRKPVCRLHFNSKKKSLTFFDIEGGERIDIKVLDDI